ncbi:MAG: carbon-nitrogen hydrolase family protein [Balneolaceae bacterium]
MSSFKAAAIQLNSQPDLDDNFNQIQPLIEKAATEGVSFVTLPENFAFFGDDKQQFLKAGEISTRVQSELPVWASKYGMYILGGGFPAPTDSDKVFNRSILAAPNGKIVASYNKMHLFDVTLSDSESYRESLIMRPGKNEAIVYEAAGLAKIGFSICYDVRFPELYRKLVDQNVEVITVPSAFTKTTGKAHWEVLLRARAIENSSYLIAPAQTGIHGNGKETYGHSLIIDPWGKVLADAGTEPGLITAEIDLGFLKEVRKKLPALQHRLF